MTDLRAFIAGQMFLTCLEVEVGWDRHCGLLPNGDSLSFLVFIPCSSDREADRADISLAFLVANSG